MNLTSAITSPIIFSGAMVRAILDGRKTQTRRVMKPQPALKPFQVVGESTGAWFTENRAYPDHGPMMSGRWKCPYGKPGDRLWVREQLCRPDGDPWVYAADNQAVVVDREDETEMLVWAHHKEQDYCPSIHMPRWASRITLEITSVRVEHVQEISETDAKAEGAEAWSQTEQDIADIQIEDCSPDIKELSRLLGPGTMPARADFQILWDSINGKRPGCAWADNPFCWVIEFKRR